MYNLSLEDIIFLMFYASVAMLSLIACCYLLFRQGNAFAKDVTPPVRLRRWTATFFAASALCHLWYLPTMVAPLIVGLALCIATRSYALLPVIFVYFLLMWLGLIIYMVRAIRQYGRWLRDNYADLEHKEVWQGFVVFPFPNSPNRLASTVPTLASTCQAGYHIQCIHQRSAHPTLH